MRNACWTTILSLLAIAIFAAAWAAEQGMVDWGTGTATIAGCGATFLALLYLLAPRYRDYAFRALREDELSERTLRVWDRLTEEFLALGFQPAGDFELQTPPMRTRIRFLLGDDLRVRGELCEIDGEISACFATCYTDGRLIETQNHASLRSSCLPERNLWYVIRKNDRLAELWELHLRAINAYEQQLEAEPIVVTPERLYELVQYGHRLVWWEMFQEPKELGPPSPPRRGESALAALEVAGAIR